MARRGLRLRCVAAALALAALAALVAPAAGRTLPASRSTAAADADAAAHRKLLLFGLTARDKAAHEENRDALIEVRGAPGAAPRPRALRHAPQADPARRTRAAARCCSAGALLRSACAAAAAVGHRP